MKNWFWLVVVVLFSQEAIAQKTSKDTVQKGQVQIITADSTVISAADSLIGNKKEKKFFPVPKTATRLALIPGGGQIYNRDYWKLPIVYIAFGGGLYAYYLNSLKYHDYLATYKSFYDLNPASPDYGQIKAGLTADSVMPIRVRNLLNTNSEMGEISRDQAARGKNYWRRNRGFALIVSGLIYTLSIIEANVAAHLKTFDLSEDLTLRVEPKLNQPQMLTPTPGLRLVFNLK
ncbi:DUF5683 domain-containing protein [Dyadobacter chenwenxiniae]|uniref:DUF5683 domain-containing protein n=1 Tax=Dyadobacter chenwenxiniae TaxID=2906456 RepID=A0A9X1PKH1_9BACT|nr:DUF5683 domain-containing protein [Dyadobacter chenwenxiniae]MCF0062431.1 DUF5683 domain-containing protein [Dyadobacter chenwenxiniae]UON83817.1 DUF5683 domain-containing protein [Dyadobacter chenwenxiniae]